MSYLNTELKIFKFDDGEDWWVVARDKKEAIKYFETECTDTTVLEEGYEVKEVTKNDDICINCREDVDLINIINRYKAIKDDEYYYVPIWTFLKYWIVECELQENEFQVPNLLASSVC